jgi:hypothetical protein
MGDRIRNHEGVVSGCDIAGAHVVRRLLDAEELAEQVVEVRLFGLTEQRVWPGLLEAIAHGCPL